MKTLNDLRAYAKERGMSERDIERLIDEIPYDTLTESDYDDYCFAIDCGTEEN